MLAMPGPVALVGSGEYTAAMLDVERGLLDGRPPPYVRVPSAGAMALAGWVARVRRPGGTGRAGLGLLPQLQVIPHFDRYFGRVPDLLARVVLRTPDGVTTIGVDEETALVGGPEDFRVHGRRS